MVRIQGEQSCLVFTDGIFITSQDSVLWRFGDEGDNKQNQNTEGAAAPCLHSPHPDHSFMTSSLDDDAFYCVNIFQLQNYQSMLKFLFIWWSSESSRSMCGP